MGGDLAVGGAPDVNGALYVGGDLAVGGTLTVSGDLAVGGAPAGFVGELVHKISQITGRL